jgi:copper chaperone CopZ
MGERQSRVTYQALDVSCGSCANLVEKFLESQAGVNSVKVNKMLNIFYIDYDQSRISEEKIEEAIRKTGYKVIKMRSISNSH